MLSTPSLFLNKNGKTATFLENNLELENIFNPKALAFYYKSNIDIGLKDLSTLNEIKAYQR